MSALLQKGHRLLAENQLGAAERLYRQVVTTDPNSISALTNLGIILARQGMGEKASACLRKVVARQPDSVDAHFNLGVLLEQRQQADEAEACYQRALALQPGHYGALMNLGAIHLRRGSHEDAAQAFRQAVDANPGSSDAFFNLGVAQRDQGDLEQADLSLERAHAMQPRDVGVLCHRAHVLKLLGRHARALDLLDQARSIAPDNHWAHHLRGEVFEEEQNLGEAQACYEKAIQCLPDHGPSYTRLGQVRIRLGRLDEAERCLRQGIARQPGDAELHLNLGAILDEQGRLSEAEQCLQEALRLRPDDPVILNNLGAICQARNLFGEAESYYRRALEESPDYCHALTNLAENLRIQGCAEEATTILDRARVIENSTGLEIAAAMMCPVIYKDNEEISDWRERIQRQVTELLLAPPDGADDEFEHVRTAFFLAYQCENDRELMTDLGRLALRIYPGLHYVAPHCQPGAARSSRRIRIGFLSSHLYQHTIAKLNGGLIAKLSRETFDVSVGTVVSDREPSEAMQTADECFLIPRNIHMARKLLAEKQFDVIFYPDIGMEKTTYCLAFARLAPVQCVTWGHPDTTGLNTLDYYLSSVDLDDESAQDHYSEKLVLLDNLPTYYYRPILPADRCHPRSYFNLPENSTLYLCPQTLFKLHPDFDAMMADILRGDPRAEIVLINQHAAHYRTLLEERWKHRMPELLPRIRFLPRLDSLDFLALLKVCDVMLDTVHFGGGNTNYEGFAMEIPIVTLPGPFMRSRVAYACYKRMGFLDCVATNPAQYVEIALRLGKDSVYRQAVRREIGQRNSVLYENMAAVRELEGFFIDALERAKTDSM